MPDPQLKIASILSHPFEENTYIAHLDGCKDCLVIDPGLEPEKILDHLDRHGLTPAALLNTHGHSDHIGGNQALKDRWPDCPLVIGAGDAAKLTDPTLNLSAQYGLPIISPAADVLLSEGDVYRAAQIELDVVELPGHSAGHIGFIYRKSSPAIVLGGDVLFAGSIGRTDFPDGSFEQLRDSIHQKLFTLPDDTVVLPGHGPPTSVGREKQSNPFV